MHERDWQSTLMSIFDELDQDHCGSLDMVELQDAFSEVGPPCLNAFGVFANVDRSNDSAIDRLEWLRMIEEVASVCDEEEVNSLALFGQRLSERKVDLGRIYKDERTARRTCVTRHDAPFRMAWDTLMLIFLLHIAMLLPFSLSFGQSSELPWFIHSWTFCSVAMSYST